MKYIVAFAGPAGSSKTPISNYLSPKFNLPIFNNDAIRTEVAEDLLKTDDKEFRQRATKRLTELFKSRKSFILDASIDRKWKNYQKQLSQSDYKIFIISLDLSRDFLINLYQAKNYSVSLPWINQLLTDHQNFLSEYSSLVNLSINDQNFIDRLSLSEKSLTSWLNEH